MGESFTASDCFLTWVWPESCPLPRKTPYGERRRGLGEVTSSCAFLILGKGKVNRSTNRQLLPVIF